eukprot:2316755-Rhodomonas_salina.2
MPGVREGGGALTVLSLATDTVRKLKTLPINAPVPRLFPCFPWAQIALLLSHSRTPEPPPFFPSHSLREITAVRRSMVQRCLLGRREWIAKSLLSTILGLWAVSAMASPVDASDSCCPIFLVLLTRSASSCIRIGGRAGIRGGGGRKKERGERGDGEKAPDKIVRSQSEPFEARLWGAISGKPGVLRAAMLFASARAV